ncbi:MAG: RagB/SusD family nutrient uptake outer membrane protein [Adhaeribacter sp.]
MKKILSYILPAFLFLSISSCQSWLDREPTDILLDEQVWGDPKLATSVLANLYDRLDPEGGFAGTGFLSHTDVDDAMWSGGLGGNNNRNTRANFPYNFRQYWNYGLIREVNLFIEKVTASTQFTAAEQQQLLAEARFIRAYAYFLHVRAMGGVPLILKTYTYNSPADVPDMQVARSTEEGVYDFIGSELDAIKDQLGNAGSKTRANKWTALALKSRAMLYAASLAKYNNLMPAPITTPGGEVGIPAARAADYYAQSLAASREIIESGSFSLYNANPDKKENFYELFTKKGSNPEVIWAMDYTLTGKFHFYTWEMIPRSMREAATASVGLVPTLNLVEAFDYLDGSPGTLKLRANGDFVYYNNLEDIFANKDARLWGTVILPGTEFGGQPVSVLAGVKEWTGSSYVTRTSGTLGATFGKDAGLLAGLDGPQPNAGNVTNTGFMTRKYLDNRSGAQQRGQGSDVWWIRFRLGEIYLNAAEAAFELGKPEDALGYVNLLRERAGFVPNSLSVLTMEKIRQERQVELALEEHRWWDLKRWRIAHELFDGQDNSPTAEKWALWPYRVYRPQDAGKHNKFVFEKQVAPRFTRPHFFRMGNYYATMPQEALNKNPLLVKNPFH